MKYKISFLKGVSLLNINSLEVRKEIDSMIDKIYPIGSYYETSDTEFSPNNTWGGTWIEDSNGLVLIGANYNGDSSVEKMDCYL